MAFFAHTIAHASRIYAMATTDVCTTLAAGAAAQPDLLRVGVI